MVIIVMMMMMMVVMMMRLPLFIEEAVLIDPLFLHCSTTSRSTPVKEKYFSQSQHDI